jgi:4-hydroxybenzoate polyprenyltransferase
VRAPAYLELIRPANVMTALADILAGYALAGLGNPSALPWLLASTACLYSGGVVLNDVFDRETDRVERPERPIPSGRVRAGSAAWFGTGLLAAGIVAGSLANRSAGLIAAVTAGVIVLYDAWGKHHPLFGPLNMGMCRGLNLLLGVAAVPAALASAWPLALLPVLYIAAVTAVSRGEVLGGTKGLVAFALISLSVVLIALLCLTLGRSAWSGTFWTLVLGWRVVPPFWAAYRAPGASEIRQAIRTGVLSLVFLDAAIGATFAGTWYSLVILATALLAFSLARIFSVT